MWGWEACHAPAGVWQYPCRSLAVPPPVSGSTMWQYHVEDGPCAEAVCDLTAINTLAPFQDRATPGVLCSPPAHRLPECLTRSRRFYFAEAPVAPEDHRQLVEVVSAAVLPCWQAMRRLSDRVAVANLPPCS